MKELEAYQTMVHFLEGRYERMPSDVLGALLGELALQSDGKPADPAVAGDWENALKQRDQTAAEPTGVTRMRRRAG